LDSSDRAAPSEVAALHVQGRLVVLYVGFDAADESVHLQGLAGLVGGSLQGAAVGAASGAVEPGVVGYWTACGRRGKRKPPKRRPDLEKMENGTLSYWPVTRPWQILSCFGQH